MLDSWVSVFKKLSGPILTFPCVLTITQFSYEVPLFSVFGCLQYINYHTNKPLTYLLSLNSHFRTVWLALLVPFTVEESDDSKLLVQGSHC